MKLRTNQVWKEHFTSTKENLFSIKERRGEGVIVNSEGSGLDTTDQVSRFRDTSPPAPTLNILTINITIMFFIGTVKPSRIHKYITCCAFNQIQMKKLTLNSLRLSFNQYRKIMIIKRCSVHNDTRRFHIVARMDCKS